MHLLFYGLSSYFISYSIWQAKNTGKIEKVIFSLTNWDNIKKCRNNVKADWFIRDLYLKFLLKNKDEDLDELHSYMMKKLNEDFIHTKNCIAIERVLERIGLKFYAPNQFENHLDFIVMTRLYNVGLEVKGKTPPWGGANLDEYKEYSKLFSEIYYVWKEQGQFFACNIGDLKIENGKFVVPTKKIALQDLLNEIKEGGNRGKM